MKIKYNFLYKAKIKTHSIGQKKTDDMENTLILSTEEKKKMRKFLDADDDISTAS